jgi:hypothetical protein
MSAASWGRLRNSYQDSTKPLASGNGFTRRSPPGCSQDSGKGGRRVEALIARLPIGASRTNPGRADGERCPDKGRFLKVSVGWSIYPIRGRQLSDRSSIVKVTVQRSIFGQPHYREALVLAASSAHDPVRGWGGCVASARQSLAPWATRRVSQCCRRRKPSECRLAIVQRQTHHYARCREAHGER